ncbi:hypothetical protein [Maricaulis sp.]|uniref:hypothetical protein n=1 Tax=Maricaulis sp. TaxID=1486257 RepID=UPI002B26A833|nr:hypothetical protein [Maricaulis sp.]
MLLVAASLTVLVGLFHSIAGEVRLIRPLLAMPDLPTLGHGPWYARALIRTAWHITTLTWWGIAAMLVVIHRAPLPDHAPLLWIISAVFTVSGVAALILSRAKHPAWLAFLPIAGLTGLEASMRAS